MEGCRSSSSSASYTLIAAMLSLLVFTVDVKSSSAQQIIVGQTNAEFINSDGETNIDFIISSCNVTRYPRLCIDSLSIHADTIQKSPRRLVYAALSVSLASAQSTIPMMHQFLNSTEQAAVRDCIETIGDSIDMLKKSIEEISYLNEPDFEFHKENIQTWVSAAMTNGDTCLDGFTDISVMDGDVKSAITSLVENLNKLTSNALALINKLTPTQSTSR
ncbi:pectinesterase inhibitor 11-like [Magnolia sinica]|uniref:pectinesterase inhibitor 11-like n=1 Tax=Magnolia sinica TaxID=86752 RepID=UPI002658B0A7|nr:pectinesterase inhibitor 11-like [Magnolia sinica]